LLAQTSVSDPVDARNAHLGEGALSRVMRARGSPCIGCAATSRRAWSPAAGGGAPVMLLAGPDSPASPNALPLEDAFLLSPATIAAAMWTLAAY